MALLPLVAGCGKKPPPRAPVVGSIQFAGQPVVGATVTFVPLVRGMRPASATTDDRGEYRLQDDRHGGTGGDRRRAHQVSIVLRGPATAAPPSGEANFLRDMQQRPLGKPLIPAARFHAGAIGPDGHRGRRGREPLRLHTRSVTRLEPAFAPRFLRVLRPDSSFCLPTR